MLDHTRRMWLSTLGTTGTADQATQNGSNCDNTPGLEQVHEALIEVASDPASRLRIEVFMFAGTIVGFDAYKFWLTVWARWGREVGRGEEQSSMW